MFAENIMRTFFLFILNISVYMDNFKGIINMELTKLTKN